MMGAMMRAMLLRSAVAPPSPAPARALGSPAARAATGRWLLAAAALWGLVAPATDAAASGGPAQPGVFRSGRFYASPIGRLAWMGVSPVAPTLALMSDLHASVAAVDLQSGRTVWSHAAAAGRLDHVWLQGQWLVLGGAQVEVLNPGTGEVAWTSSLDCAGAGTCARVVRAVADSGVYVSGAGVAHTRLERLDLATGRARWDRPAAVYHPRAVEVRGGTVLVREALPPFGLRALSVETGDALWTWAWEVAAGATEPPDLVALAPDGTAAAVRLRAGDGSLAQEALLQPRGLAAGAGSAKAGANKHVELSVRRVSLAPPTPHAPHRPVWARIAGPTLFALVPDPAARRVSLARSVLGTPSVTADTARWLQEPVVLGDRVVAYGRDGDGLVLSAYDVATGARAWRYRAQVPRRDATILGAGPLVVAALRQPGAPFLVVSRRDGGLVGAGILDPDEQDVLGAADVEGTLYLGTRGGVQEVRSMALGDVAREVRAALAEGRPEDAQALWEAVALFPGGSPDLLAAQREVMAERARRMRRLGARGEPASAVRGLLSALTGARVEQLAAAAASAHVVAGIVGDLVLAGRRTAGRGQRNHSRGRRGARKSAGARELGGAIAAPGGEFAAIVRRVGPSLGDPGASAAREDLRAAALVLAASSLRAGVAGVSAELLAVWMAQPRGNDAGVVALYAYAAGEALGELVRALQPQLEGGDPVAIRRAAQLLAEYPHGGVALGDDDGLLARAADLAGTGDAAAAAALSAGLREALKRRGVGGSSLAAAGCEAVCEALGRVCQGGCRDGARCSKAAAKCARGCRRGKMGRWKAPKQTAACR